jgi:hypothetical protein
LYRRTRAYTVTLDADDDLEVCYQAAGLPLIGTPFGNGFNFVFCDNLRPQRVSPIMAIVTAQYSGEVGQNAVPGGSPVDNPVVVSWGASITDEPIDEDIHGNPIVTANNEPIDGLTERVPDLTLNLQRNFLTVNTYSLLEYLRSVNSDEFFGWPAGTVRLIEYSANRVFGASQDGGFWRTSATFQLRRPYNTTPQKAWWKRVRHEGFMVRAVADGDIFHGEDDGDPPRLLSRPVLLKPSGLRERNPENAHFLEFETVFPLPYNTLGFT